MFVRFTSVGNEFSLPLFLQPKEVSLTISHCAEFSQKDIRDEIWTLGTKNVPKKTKIRAKSSSKKCPYIYKELSYRMEPSWFIPYGHHKTVFGPKKMSRP
jgi:hypothetical protein